MKKLFGRFANSISTQSTFSEKKIQCVSPDYIPVELLSDSGKILKITAVDCLIPCIFSFKMSMSISFSKNFSFKMSMWISFSRNFSFKMSLLISF